MSDSQIIDHPERITRRDLAEGNVGKILSEKTALVEVSDELGGLRFDNALQMAEAAKIMATAGPMLPPWLQGNVGGCWGIILKSVELQMSPMTLASMTYLVKNKGVEQVAYMSNFFRTIVEARAKIKEGRLQCRYEGEGDDLKCIVYATFIGQSEPSVWPPADQAGEFTLGKLRPGRNEYGQVKGSQLWDDKPPLQMFYAMSRDWARVFCSALVAGMYGRDELEDEAARHQGARHAKDISPVRQRMLGAENRDGFVGAEKVAQNIDAAIGAARAGSKPINQEASGTAREAPSTGSGTAAAVEVQPAPPSQQEPSERRAAPASEPDAAPAVTDSRPASDAPGGGGSPPPASAATASLGERLEQKLKAPSKPAYTPGPGRHIHDATVGESFRISDEEVAAARQRGRDDRKRGVKRSATPMEWRGPNATALALAWVEGWNEAKP